MMVQSPWGRYLLTTFFYITHSPINSSSTSPCLEWLGELAASEGFVTDERSVGVSESLKNIFFRVTSSAFAALYR